ncbi:MAG: polyribonucleotide nucleotidyltransferase, partial [Bacteroidetes bacterium]|nr:polyribonucleotide nucleotidyltransferase [Bacteroidota bacterium]
SFSFDKIAEVAKSASAKAERSAALKAIKEEFIATLPEDHDKDMFLVGKYFHDVEKDAIRNVVLETRKRLDGRELTEVRPIWSEVAYLPSPHGSAVFTRGETQALTSVTLGSKLDEQLLDSPMNAGYSKFMLHYNFPAFSTGEVKPNRGPARREIGHGNLASRAIRKVMPNKENNPYTVRIVSDVLESNGSSSMATVCASSLALFDAGMPMKSAVSGIAMGMISDEKTGKYAILSDILGDEDHLGDMDFKVCGTEKGIVACQMDIKVNGLSYDVLAEALNQAKQGRLHILGKMNETISKPNDDFKPHTPRIETIYVDTEYIGAIIGPGGKVIQQLQKDTGTTVSITEEGNKGIVEVMAVDGEGMAKVRNFIKGLTTKPEVGEVYEGKVKTIQPFGAFVEFMPGKDGLLHISEISWSRIETMDGVLNVGDSIQVKLVEIDQKTGKYRLSRKVLLPREPRVTENQAK